MLLLESQHSQNMFQHEILLSHFSLYLILFSFRFTVWWICNCTHAILKYLQSTNTNTIKWKWNLVLHLSCSLHSNLAGTWGYISSHKQICSIMSHTIIDSNVISECCYDVGIYVGYCLSFPLVKLKCCHAYIRILMSVSCPAFFTHTNFPWSEKETPNIMHRLPTLRLISTGSSYLHDLRISLSAWFLPFPFPLGNCRYVSRGLCKSIPGGSTLESDYW